MLKVGVLGAGRIGQVHATNIAGHPDSVLAAVSDVHLPAAQALAERYGAAVQSSEEIIADPTIGAVLIASSTDTHCDFIEAAAAAGKAVLCEKPVDLSLARARDCLEKTKTATQPIMIAHNRRFDPNLAALRAALQNGEIGTPELLSITSFDPAPPTLAYVEVSGGLFRDMMIHDFDLAQFLMGGAPVQVSAMGSALVSAEIGAAGDVDTAVVTLRYADGRLAVIKNSRRAAYGYDQRVEVLGSDGLLSMGNVLQTTVLKATDAGILGAKPEYFFLERYSRAYAIEWAEFVAAVVTGAPVPVPLEAGVAALTVADAAARSAETGQPVTL